jgi:hypothetical protein
MVVRSMAQLLENNKGGIWPKGKLSDLAHGKDQSDPYRVRVRVRE